MKLGRFVACVCASFTLVAASAAGCATGSLLGDGPDADASSTSNDAALVCDACPDGEVCSNGKCTSTCPSGQTACSGNCVVLASNASHCGSCSNACGTGFTCVNSQCVCASPTLGCTPPDASTLVCVDPSKDIDNCGSCGNACTDGGQNALPGCIDGGCGIGSCVGSYADCNKTATDGCESPLKNDKNNCGSCGFVCDAGSPACIDGGCVKDACGNGVIDTGERCDGTTGVPSGGQISCRNPGSTNECKFDFSQVPQLYCNGSCSWGGATDCDQADADIYCKLITGSSTSTASSFSVVTAKAVGGFPCPNGSYGSNLGTMPEYGVNVNVWYQGTSILGNHGPGNVIGSATCTP